MDDKKLQEAAEKYNQELGKCRDVTWNDGEYGFLACGKWFMEQPLNDRLTHNEKLMVRDMYQYAKTMLESSEDKAVYEERIKILESIFGPDTFNGTMPTTRRTFKMKDEDGHAVNLRLKDKLICRFADSRGVLMGETVDGTYAMELKNPPDCGRFARQGVHLTEGSLIAYYVTMSIYLQHKGIDVTEMLKKYLPEDNDGGVPTSYEQYAEDDNED